jgi:aspartate racemase
MKTIGLIGGLSWHSTPHYYRILNELAQSRFGDHTSCPLIISSVNFQKIVELQKRGNWQEMGSFIWNESSRLALAGAEGIAICSNTMHKCLNFLPKELPLPIVHIGTALGDFCAEQKFERIAFLGTRFAMRNKTFHNEIAHKHNLQIMLPNQKQMTTIDRIIFEELTLGIISVTSQQKYLEICSDLKIQGAEAIIMGCTEIGLLLNPDSEQSELKKNIAAADISPLVDSLKIHADSIFNWIT